MNNSNWKILIVLATVFLFIMLFFGWPTPYRYMVLQRSMGCGGNACTVVVRINRVTGKAQWNDGQHGWLPAIEPASDPWAHTFDQPKKD